MLRLLGAAMFAFLLAGTSILADEAQLSFGGDEFAAGQSVAIDQPQVPRDAFIAGYDVSLGGAVLGDAHLAGFNVRDEARVTGDVYAGGFTVDVTGPVGGDLTAMGNMITIGSAATVAGNVRMAGARITLSAPVSGAVLITAGHLTLDAPVAGDMEFIGETISFGPNAKIGGKLRIQAPSEIPVPATVAPAGQVSFQRLVAPDYASQAGKTAQHVVNSFWPAVWTTGLWWLLLFVVGLTFIALTPRLVRNLMTAAEKRPFRNLGLGFLAFASVVGLVPISALTIVGLLATPLFVLLAIAMFALAYLVGAYLIGGRLLGALTSLDTTAKRALGLAASILVTGLLGMIPVIGWLLTLLVATFGFGALALLVMVRWSRNDASRLSDAATSSAPEAA